MRWLRNFRDDVVSVAWQAYPGHEPCPIPVPPELFYQWQSAPSMIHRSAEKQRLLADARQMLGTPGFPAALLNRGYLRLAFWIYNLGIRDTQHIIRVARVYDEFWRKSSGKYFGQP